MKKFLMFLGILVCGLLVSCTNDSLKRGDVFVDTKFGTDTIIIHDLSSDFKSFRYISPTDKISNLCNSSTKGDTVIRVYTEKRVKDLKNNYKLIGEIDIDSLDDVLKSEMIVYYQLQKTADSLANATTEVLLSF